ncbi:hypothetical protein [Deinococcus sp.]|uniref:hypothetical protein n=1 Tax=Deinococcus sp. TaxID=47478 RepID=UPI003C7A7637
MVTHRPDVALARDAGDVDVVVVRPFTAKIVAAQLNAHTARQQMRPPVRDARVGHETPRDVQPVPVLAVEVYRTLPGVGVMNTRLGIVPLGLDRMRPYPWSRLNLI